MTVREMLKDGTSRIHRVLYNPRLVSPEGYAVTIGSKRKFFQIGEERKIGQWIIDQWESAPYDTASVYYRYTLDTPDVLYCTYELIGDEFFTADSLEALRNT